MSGTLENLIAIQAEAGGVIDLHLIRPSDRPSLLAAMERGDTAATWVLQRVAASMMHIETNPLECWCCPCVMSQHDYAIAILVPRCDDPKNWLAFPVCAACGPTQEKSRAKAEAAVRAVWPALRQIRIMAGGRA